MSLKITKTVTENPFIDQLLYYLKVLAYGCIIKDEDEAIDGETAETAAAWDEYSAAIENRATFELYTYDRTILEASSLPPAQVDACLIDKDNIPESYRTEILNLKKAYIIAHFEEKNPYYRKVTGLPPVGEDGILITNYIHMIPAGNLYDPTMYIHEMDTDTIRMLNSYGVIDAIIADNPDKKYLKYLVAGIDLYDARNALRFQILYHPTVDNQDVMKKFQDKYMNNRNYVLQCVYSEAFKYGSDYYDKFIMCFLILQTMTDMLAEVQEHIVLKNILDRRCVAYIFESYGVPYYREIPWKYQVAMVKNINKLIKFKSCCQGMINICELFGCSDIQVFKYFLLKDRRLNQYGEYQFNYNETITSDENTCIRNEEHSVTLPISGEITIPFPFQYYMEKGNVLFIRLDDHLLQETEWVIYDDNKLELVDRNVLNGHTTMTFMFYYDETTRDTPYSQTTDYNMGVATADVSITSNTQLTYTIPVPYPDYLADGHTFAISIGSTFVDKDRYVINTDGTISFLSTESWMSTSRKLTFIFIYSSHINAVFTKAEVVATENDQTVFIIPEPFTNYCASGNSFFITIGSTFIDPTRYVVNGNVLSLVSVTDALSLGRKIAFNFIYNTDNVYHHINLTHEQLDIVATDAYQTVFNVTYPFPNYLAQGHRVYVKLLGWYVEADKYELNNLTLTLPDMSMALQPGDIISLHFFYNTDADIATNTSFVTATIGGQTEFNINFPFDHYLERGNALIVDVNGIYLAPSKYTITDGLLSITDHAYSASRYDNINYTFVYDTKNMYNIALKTYTATATTNNQTSFIVRYPFYGYIESQNKYLVLYKSTFIHPDRYTVTRGRLVLNGMSVPLGHEITIMFIYDTIYERFARALIVERRTLNTLEALGDEACIEIPQPFPDYVEHNYPFFLDHDLTYMHEDTYDTINTSTVFNDLATVMTYPTVSYTFIYKYSMLHIVTEEDYANNYDLKFVKVPLTDFAADKYIKRHSNYMNYDSITLEDPLWDGESAHEDVKLTILKKEFNYIRTKYLSVDYVVNLTEMAFEISYFYNMLWDDIKLEEDLKISLPCISENTQFQLADIFVYLTVLAYDYSGIEDRIMAVPTHTLYVQGFNFHTDLDTLRNYIINERRYPSDYAKVWEWKRETEQLTSISQFLDIYRTDKDIYKFICAERWKSRDKTIYDIWKKLYDSLMITKFNLDFFKLSNGTVASTFTEFLFERNRVLYNSIMTIRANTDEDTRLNAIIQMITDIVYLMEDYIDSDEFKYIYSNLPGTSRRYLLHYVFKIINFFKSYKVILFEMNVQFTLNDKNQNMIRPMDKNIMLIHLEKSDLVHPVEKMTSTQSRTFKDRVELLERYQFTPYYE